MTTTAYRRPPQPSEPAAIHGRPAPVAGGRHHRPAPQDVTQQIPVAVRPVTPAPTGARPAASGPAAPRTAAPPPAGHPAMPHPAAAHGTSSHRGAAHPATSRSGGSGPVTLRSLASRSIAPGQIPFHPAASGSAPFRATASGPFRAPTYGPASSRPAGSAPGAFASHPATSSPAPRRSGTMLRIRTRSGPLHAGVLIAAVLAAVLCVGSVVAAVADRAGGSSSSSSSTTSTYTTPLGCEVADTDSPAQWFDCTERELADRVCDTDVSAVTPLRDAGGDGSMSSLYVGSGSSVFVAYSGTATGGMSVSCDGGFALDIAADDMRQLMRAGSLSDLSYSLRSRLD